MSLFDYDEDYAGKVLRTKDGRPYVLANPDWLSAAQSMDHYERDHPGFTDKPGEPRGPSAIYTRVTTYISCLEDTYALGLWQDRMVVVGLTVRPQLVARAQRVDLDNPEKAYAELNEIARQAKDAANWKLKADLGTDFHEIAHAYDKGRRNWKTLSPESKAMLAAYIVKTKGFEYAHIEQGMINDELRTYGTPDMLRWVDRTYEGGTWKHGKKVASTSRTVRTLRVVDIKTGRIDMGWQKMELQLALYAISQLYDPDTGIRTDLDIDQEYAEIIHVPYGQGKAEVFVIPIADAIRELRELVPRVRAWRARKPAWVPTDQAAIDSGVAAAWAMQPPEVL